VRRARDPLNAPAAGALIAALSHEKKKLAKSGDGAAEELAAAPSGRIGSKVDVGDGVDPSALLGREPAVPVAARAAAARPSGNGNGAKPRV
jgi:hypothetical protein